MKKAYIYLTFIVMAVLAVACSKNGSMVDSKNSDATQEDKIGIGTASAKLSGALTPDKNSPLQIKVYDYFTPTGGTELTYIDDYIQKAESGAAWAFTTKDENGNYMEYSWKRGDHKFFGWVYSEDGKTELSGISYAGKKVTFSAPKVDYRYSDLVAVQWPAEKMFIYVDGKKTGVEPVDLLKLHHLTAALTYTVHNFTDQSVTINSIQVNNVISDGSAEVDYSGTKAKVTYTPGTDKTTGISLNLAATPVEDAKDAVKTCVWPQQVKNATLTINYTLGTAAATEVTVDIPNTAWEAGKYYNFDLQLVNKTITLTFTVADWETVEGVDNVDTSTGSINMSNVTWMNAKVMVDGVEKNTLDNDNESVTLYKVDGSYKHVIYETYEEDVVDEETGEVHKAGDPIVKIEDVAYAYQPAQGYFTVNYPRTGKYFIAIIPAKGESAVDASKYQIMIYDSKTKSWRDYDAVNGEDVTNDTIYFRIFAASEQDGKEHKAQIDIWFQPEAGGEKISAYSEIRANYTLIIPAS